jgi:hypothetical protein
MEDIERMIRRERNRIHLSRSIHTDSRNTPEEILAICFGIYYLDIDVAKKASRGDYGNKNYRIWRMSDRIYALGENQETDKWAVFEDSDNRRHLFYFDEQEESGMDTTKLSLEGVCAIYKGVFSGRQEQVEERMYQEILDKAIAYLHRPSPVIGIQNPILVDNWKKVVIRKNEQNEEDE